ncbi:MAG: YqaA family protein [Nitrospirota bacterium]|nr:YqaA family protein [Nitrospirota bacterium]
MEFFTDFGYLGLFLASFLAATILPLSSEVVLGYLLANGYNPAMTVGVATVGNVLGACLNYAVGLWGSGLFIRRILRVSEDEFAGAKKRFEKYGVASLLFAWVPIIGDPLTFAAGALRINIAVFLVLVTTGKLIRYFVVGYAVL